MRAFSPADLHFVCTLPRPHPVGSDISALTEARWGKAQEQHSLQLAAIHSTIKSMTLFIEPLVSSGFCLNRSSVLFLKKTRDEMLFCSFMFHGLYKFISTFLSTAIYLTPRRMPVTQTRLLLPMTLWAVGSAVCTVTTVCMCGMWEMCTGWGRCTLPSSTLHLSGTWR